MSNYQNNKRIVKNSFYLYVRMFFTIIVSLYTSRVVLHQLGEDDFGIYSVVGGLAVMFSFFSNAFTATTQRFLTVEIGKGDSISIKRMFSMSVNSHIIISLLIILCAETIGLWLLNTQLNIPTNRQSAANWVYQFGVLSLILSILNTPYIACIIAYEKMNYFALTSIINVSLKLLIVFILVDSVFDKLVYYSALLVVISVIKFLMDRIYCVARFPNCSYIYYWDKSLFKTVFGFTGWNLFKTGAVVGVNQGNNILVNIFGGTVASAAMGLANQVNGTIFSFMQNVQIAFNPQITKTYSNNEKNVFYSLTMNAAKLSTVMLLFVALPLYLNMEYILNFWLGEYPAGTALLCRIAILSCFVDSLSGPLTTAVMAYGNIRKYQIITSVLWIISIPLSVVLLLLGFSFAVVLYSKVLCQTSVLVYSAVFLKNRLFFPLNRFLWNVCGIVAVIMILVLAVTGGILDLLPDLSLFQHFVISSFISWFLLFTLVYYIAFSKHERKVIFEIIRSLYNRLW